MEVHHHHHVPQGKKRFTEYFLEFVMIFLAVTMGFFAESQREHISENKKKHEFIKGVIGDLKTDTTKLLNLLKYYAYIIPLMVSGRKNFYPSQQKRYLKELSILQLSFAGFEDFIYTDATLQQVKSTGGLLLIKNNAWHG